MPQAIQARGLIDGGRTLTAVAPRLLAALNAPAGQTVKTTTASGAVNVQLYRISFTIYDLSTGVTLTRADWDVPGLAADLDDVDVLFGLDLLHEVVLTVDGPAGRFAIDF